MQRREGPPCPLCIAFRMHGHPQLPYRMGSLPLLEGDEGSYRHTTLLSVEQNPQAPMLPDQEASISREVAELLATAEAIPDNAPQGAYVVDLGAPDLAPAAMPDQAAAPMALTPTPGRMAYELQRLILLVPLSASPTKCLLQGSILSLCPRPSHGILQRMLHVLEK